MSSTMNFYGLSLIWLSLALVYAQQSPPCTLSVKGTTAVLSNSLISFTVDTTTATWSELFAPSLTSENFIGNGGNANWDRETPAETRPSDLTLDIVSNVDDFVHIRMYENSGTHNFPNFDWEFHYAIRRGFGGIYLWSVVTHPEGSAKDSWGQWRWIARANSGSAAKNFSDALFDSVQVAEDVWRYQPSVEEALGGTTLSPQEAERVTLKNGSTFVEHKYDYCTDSWEHLVNGMYHSQTGLGMWTITPSYEFKNGNFDNQDLTSYGPTKYTGLYFAHIQSLEGGHYGAGDEVINEDEQWSKTYGPFILYLNKARSRSDLWADAMKVYNFEKAMWPYTFVNDSSYSSANRAAVSGILTVIDTADPRIKSPTAGNAMIWLTAPTATNGPYYRQSKGYVYWIRAALDGSFVFPNVRSGTYEIHAYIDGVFGEFVSSGTYSVKGGIPLNVGTLTFTVPRNASTLFEIGYADRTAKEYYHGDNYRNWGLYDLFGTDFPKGINYNIGSWQQPASQWRSAWNYAHVPWNNSSVDWLVTFNVDQINTIGPNGYIRIAFAGVVHCQLALAINGNALSPILDLNDNDNSVYRDAIHGIYETRVVTFPTKFLLATNNVLTLTNKCTARFDGIMYDYLRMELDGYIPKQIQVS